MKIGVHLQCSAKVMWRGQCLRVWNRRSKDRIFRQVIKCYAVVCNLTCIVIFSLRELNDKSMMKNVCMYKCVKNSVFLSKQFPKQRKTIVKSRSSWQNHRNLIKYEFASQNRFGETIDIYGSNIKVIPSCRLLVMMKY
jgi:hypothetical protein